jgi:acyl carrier protein
MGLDGVELVMALEEAFGVSISDAEAADLLTPRMVGDLIYSKLDQTEQSICQSQRAFYLLRKAMMRRLQLTRATFKPDTVFRDLVPEGQLLQFLQDLKVEVRARSWPSAVRPRWLVNCICGFACAVSVLVWYATKEPLGKEIGSILGVITAIVTGISLARLTRPFRIIVPLRYRKVRDLVPFVVTSDQIKWTREQVSVVVKRLTMEQLGLKEAQYWEDAHFVKDLGLDG